MPELLLTQPYCMHNSASSAHCRSLYYKPPVVVDGSPTNSTCYVYISITARSCAAMERQEAPYRTRYRTHLTIEIAMMRIIGCAAPSSHAPRPPAFDFALTWGHGIVSCLLAFFHNFQPPTASPNFSCALLNSRTYRPGVIKPRVSTRACRP